MHYHAHLDIITNGRGVPVPAGIGFVVHDGQVDGLTSLHTHAPDGVIHVESPRNVPFTLGQVFTEWNLRLTSRCIGGLCDDAARSFRVFVDGRPYPGDPTTLVLRPHQEIALWSGQRDSSPTVPSRYDFPPGE